MEILKLLILILPITHVHMHEHILDLNPPSSKLKTTNFSCSRVLIIKYKAKIIVIKFNRL